MENNFDAVWEAMQAADNDNDDEKTPINEAPDPDSNYSDRKDTDVPFDELLKLSLNDMEALSRDDQVSGEDFDHYMVHWWNESVRLGEPGIGDKQYLMDKCKFCGQEFQHGPSRNYESVKEGAVESDTNEDLHGWGGGRGAGPKYSGDDDIKPEDIASDEEEAREVDANVDAEDLFDEQMATGRAHRRGADLSPEQDEVADGGASEISVDDTVELAGILGFEMDAEGNVMTVNGPVSAEDFHAKIVQDIEDMAKRDAPEEGMEEAADSVDMTGKEDRMFDDQKEADADLKNRMGLGKKAVSIQTGDDNLFHLTGDIDPKDEELTDLSKIGWELYSDAQKAVKKAGYTQIKEAEADEAYNHVVGGKPADKAINALFDKLNALREEGKDKVKGGEYDDVLKELRAMTNARLGNKVAEGEEEVSERYMKKDYINMAGVIHGIADNDAIVDRFVAFFQNDSDASKDGKFNEAWFRKAASN